ncbi:hypothetical protein [Streptomyces canus]|uniref:hypothetical protein n=1 Tax=Streptomyces canus TaxID=58343 RepID=UPI0027D8A16C|nr:hypothetical protein [Streptomyces canus]
MRYDLFTALDLFPAHPSEFDRWLKTALAERARTFLVDEAQGLNGEAFEYFRAGSKGLALLLGCVNLTADLGC